MLTNSKFKCRVTGRFYNVRGNFPCNNSNLIYFTSSKSCEDQYIGPALDFKTSRSNLEFTKVTWKLRNIYVALPSILMINALISKTRISLIKSVKTGLDLEIIIGKGRNIGNVGYLPRHLSWIVFLIYMLVKKGCIKTMLRCSYCYIWLSRTITALCCLVTAY